MEKSGLAIMIAKMRPKGMEAHEPEEETESGEASEYDEGLRTTAKEILDAVSAKDEDALADALHDFFVQCDAQPHREGKHEGEETEEE